MQTKSGKTCVNSGRERSSEKRHVFYTAKERNKGACGQWGEWKHSNVSLRDRACDSLRWSSWRAKTLHFSPLGASHVIQQVGLTSSLLQSGVEGRGILQICLFGSAPVKYFYLGTGGCGHFPGVYFHSGQVLKGSLEVLLITFCCSPPFSFA